MKKFTAYVANNKSKIIVRSLLVVGTAAALLVSAGLIAKRVADGDLELEATES